MQKFVANESLFSCVFYIIFYNRNCNILCGWSKSYKTALKVSIPQKEVSFGEQKLKTKHRFLNIQNGIRDDFIFPNQIRYCFIMLYTQKENNALLRFLYTGKKTIFVPRIWWMKRALKVLDFAIFLPKRMVTEKWSPKLFIHVKM